MDNIKTCIHCGMTAGLEFFEKKRNVCKECRRQQQRIRAEKNKDHVKKYRKEYERKNANAIALRKKEWFRQNRDSEIERMKKWKADNALAVKNYKKQYAIEHREEIKKRQQEYREQNKETSKQALAAWKEQNPDKVQEHRARYGAARRIRAFNEFAEIDRSITKQQLFERDGYICHICGQPINPELPSCDNLSAVIDHLFPIAFGGQHTWDNVGIAHFSCNARMKHSLQIP